jgi:hypothetical protein
VPYIGRFDCADIFTIGDVYIVSPGTVTLERVISKFVICGTYVLSRPILYNIGLDQLTAIYCFVKLDDINLGAGGLPTILLNIHESILNIESTYVSTFVLYLASRIPVPPRSDAEKSLSKLFDASWPCIDPFTSNAYEGVLHLMPALDNTKRLFVVKLFEKPYTIVERVDTPLLGCAATVERP